MEVRADVPETREVDALGVAWFEGDPDGEGWWSALAGPWLERSSAAGSERPAGWAALGRDDRPDLYIKRCAGDRYRGIRAAAGAFIRAARDHGVASAAFLVPEAPDPARAWQAAAEGLALGDWKYEGLRESGQGSPAPAVRVLCARGAEPAEAGRAAARRGMRLASAQNVARELVTLPGNVATPAFLADTVREKGDAHGLRVQAWGEEKLRREGFGALLAVARGSREEPFFIIAEHEGEGGDPCVIVGKGVTFDAGGISLKPPKGMEDMKYDMSGAAAVIGSLVAAAELGIRQRLIGLIPATENLPSGTALKPGDVVRGLSGRSIEVLNTDAEGRLILSDALTYAQRLSPRAIVDLATLTGACVVALGHHAIGLMANDAELAARLRDAGEVSGERVWELPLWPEYRKQLDSKIADLKNTGGRPAGTITAGWFLRTFVDDSVPWAHLDIAGTAWSEEARDWQPEGATGVGVRLLLEWLRDRS